MGGCDGMLCVLQKLKKLMTGKSNKLESKFRLEYRCGPPDAAPLVQPDLGVC